LDLLLPAVDKVIIVIAANERNNMSKYMVENNKQSLYYNIPSKYGNSNH